MREPLGSDQAARLPSSPESAQLGLGLGQSLINQFCLPNFSIGQPPATKTMDVVVLNASSTPPYSGSYSYDKSGQTIPHITWVGKSFTFTATSNSSPLEFISTSTASPACGPA